MKVEFKIDDDNYLWLSIGNKSILIEPGDEFDVVRKIKDACEKFYIDNMDDDL